MTPNRKRINARNNEPIMYKVCAELGVTVKEFHVNSFRLSKAGFVTVDYFTGTGKCFFHDTKEFGETTDTEGFIRYQFTEKQESRQ